MGIRRGFLVGSALFVLVVAGLLLAKGWTYAKQPGPSTGIVALEHHGSSLWAASSDGTIYHSVQDTDGWAGGPFEAVGRVPGAPVAIAVSDGHGDVYVSLSNGDLYWAIAPGPGPASFTLRRNILAP